MTTASQISSFLDLRNPLTNLLPPTPFPLPTSLQIPAFDLLPAKVPMVNLPESSNSLEEDVDSLASTSSRACEAPPPLPRLPLMISESLRSAVFSDVSTQGVVSILLSATDFAKLDLSKLQLFTVDGLTTEPLASSEVAPPQTEIQTSPNEDFSLHTPFAERSPGAVSILKSKGVVEAEKASAEHQLLKLGAISPSPRARKKAISMDEISLTRNFGNVDTGVTERSNGGLSMAAIPRVRAKRQLPEPELAPMSPHGLEQRAETLKKKHFERVLSRTLSELRSKEAKIELEVSSAAKFLLQLMPWELTPPVTPVTTPTGIPFIWEDAPGRPKPYVVPSPCSSLPLPPRLLALRPSSSAVATGTLSCPLLDFAKQPAVGEHLSLSKNNPSDDGTHRKNMHSWHVSHNRFSGSHQQYSSQAADPSLEAKPLASEPKHRYHSVSETSRDGMSSGSTSVHSNSTSFDLSLSPATASEDAFGARCELPPMHVAPVGPLTPTDRHSGPLEDGSGKQANRLSYLARLFCLEKHQRGSISTMRSLLSPFSKHGKQARESKRCLLDDANEFQRRAGYGSQQAVQCRAKACSEVTSRTRRVSVSAQMSPMAARLCRSPRPSTPRIQMGSGRTKVFLRLRRRGARVLVCSYRAIKRVLFLKRSSHSRLSNHAQLPYHARHR